MLLLAFLAASSLTNLEQLQNWKPWTPRESIRPLLARATSPGPQGKPALLVAGGGNPGVCGGWSTRLGEIEPGAWYRLTASYTAQGFKHEPSELFARLDWESGKGNRTGQPEYGYRVKPSGDSRSLILEAPAPPEAAAVQIQLAIWKAPAGKVWWHSISLERIDPPAKREVHIAAIRLRPSGPDPVKRFLDLAQSMKGTADLIVFPEGITVVGTNKKYAEVAEPVPGPATLRLSNLARSKNAWVVAGVYEREGALVYNTSVLIDRLGRIAGKYRKVYIPREEMEGGITPGSAYPVFDTDFGKLGMMICWDVQYADPARALALQGAEIIAMPIWGGNETLAKARAIENHVFLATSGYDFPSLVFDPAGETLARTEQDGTIAYTAVDLNRRYADKWLGNMRARFFREVRGDVPAESGDRP